MKGLLIKDLKLMKMQKKFLFVVLAMAIMLAFTSRDISFIVGYLTFVMSFFAVSTISYDEFDNGYLFLFTLPVSRKTYVVEKYCFSFFLTLVSSAVAMLITVGYRMIKPDFDLTSVAVALPGVIAACVLFLSLMIPIQLKFGAEKGRIAMIVAVGVLLLAGFGVAELVKIAELDVMSVLGDFMQNVWLMALCVTTAVVAVLVLSMKISMIIMDKKEL